MSKFWVIQDENEEYEFTNVLEALDDKDKEIERLNNRIEKAVEYIKKHLEDKKYLNEIYTDEKVLNIVLDILNGRSDE